MADAAVAAGTGAQGLVGHGAPEGRPASPGRTIDFFLDFISPYAYLVNSRIGAIAAKWGCAIRYMPVDVAAAKVAAGNTGPSTRAIPAKRRYIREDRLRWARSYGLPMNDPKAFLSPRLNSGIFLAERLRIAPDYVERAFHRVWGEGGDPDSDDLIAQVARDLGWNAEDLLAFVNSDEARTMLAASQQEAVTRGVFGVPMIIVGDGMFWGNDRLDFLEQHLAGMGSPDQTSAAQAGQREQA